MKIWLTLLLGLLLLTDIEAKRGDRKGGRKGGKGGRRGGKGGRQKGGRKQRPPKRQRPTPTPAPVVPVVAAGAAAGAAAAGAAGAASGPVRSGPLRWEGPTPPAGTYPKSCHDIFESHAKECKKPEGGFYAIQVRRYHTHFNI